MTKREGAGKRESGAGKKGASGRRERGSKGPRMRCEECGLVVLVEDPCGCDACDLICCGVPMRPC